MSEHNPVLSPKHYAGNGTIECKHAMESMIQGWEENGNVDYNTAYWLTCAFKYLWRAPIKNGLEDINKAMECLANAQASWLRYIPTKVDKEILATSRGVREKFLWNPNVYGEINEEELLKAKKVWKETDLDDVDLDKYISYAADNGHTRNVGRFLDKTAEDYDAEKYAEARKHPF